MKNSNNRMAVVFLLLMTAVAVAVGCRTGDPGGNGNSDQGDWDMSREKFEKQRERFEREARELGRKVGSNSNDLWLWTKVRAALAYADDLRDVTVNVDVEDEIVTLRGTVPDKTQKTNAEEIARSVEGIKSIRNEIAVSANRNAS